MANATTPISEARLMSIAQVASEWGMSRDKVRRLLARVPTMGEKNGSPAYAIRDVARVMVLDELNISPDGDIDPERMPPKDRKDWYDGEARRLEIARKAGVLVEAELVREVIAGLFLKVRNTLSSLPDVLERDTGLEPDRIGRVQRAVDTLAAGLAEDVARETWSAGGDETESASG